MNEMIGRPILAGDLHFLECLAIALGMGAAEMTRFALRQVLPLLMADEHDLDVVEMGEARDDRLVVAEGTVTVQLEELLEDQARDSRGFAGAAGAATPERFARGRGSNRSRA